MTPEQLLQHHDHSSLWPARTRFTPAIALEHALALRALRVARGERPAGFKIGFTNRTIWPRYGVFAPIWGTVYDTTLQFCEGEGEVSLARTCQPRIEPECVFGLARAPAADAGLQELRDAIDWVAPGFEVVQSHLQDWKFEAPDTVADGGLHARLLVGRRQAAANLPADALAFDTLLARATVSLWRDGTCVDRGQGTNVLDGPLHALLHFVQALRSSPGAPDLRAGDVITTGTWTDAWPVAAGERWEARFDGALSPLAVRFGG